MVDTIPAALVAAAERFGSKPAYAEGNRVLTFSSLLQEVRRTAAGYAAQGMSPGDRVCVWSPAGIDWVIAALAATYAGGTLVPVNSRLTVGEAVAIIERTGATLVVAGNGLLDRHQLEGLTADPPAVRAIIDIADLAGLGADADESTDAIASAVGPDDIADVLVGAETTGRPKGAMSAHSQTVGLARTWAGIFGVNSHDRYLVADPLFHSFGYRIGVVTGLLTGARLHTLATFDPDDAMDVIERQRITILPGAPTIYRSLLAASSRAEHDLSSVRLAATGASAMSLPLVKQMCAPAPDGLGITQVVNGFGSVEAVLATVCRPGDSAETAGTTRGRPVAGMEVRIAAGSNAAEPGGPAKPGEVLLRGDFVMRGYLDDPRATAEAIDSEGWLHTGDAGFVDDEGNLRISDRLSDVYTSDGLTVYPAEVEQTLAELDGVQDVAVVGVRDERMGEVGRAFVVGDLSEEDVIAFAEERLADSEVPRSVVFLDALPRNGSGTVLKDELRSRR